MASYKNSQNKYSRDSDNHSNVKYKTRMVRGGGSGGSGRGFGRGGGSGRGGSSYRGSSSNYRSGSGRNASFSNSSTYNSSRGGNYSSSSNYNSNSTSYESRSRDRASSSRHSDRHDTKRSYRQVSPRDRSPDRKRSRHEDSRLSSSYSSYRRNESSRSRQTPPPPPAVRPSSSTYRGHRDESSSHRHSSVNDSMGPPKSMAPRSGGRIIRSRGGAGGIRLRGGSSRGIIRRRESSDMRIMRKKLLLARQRDRARRIKIAKLASSLRKRKDVPRKSVRSSKSKKDDDESKNEDDEKNKSKDDGVDEDVEIVKGEKGEETDGKIASNGNVKIKKEVKTEDIEPEDDEDKDGDAEENEDDEEENNNDDDDDNNSKSKSKSRKKKPFIKLTCIHCRMKCLTFKEYSNHLYSRTHIVAMRRLALRQKAKLSHMRLTQRNTQRDIEENSKNETDDCKPQFCFLCRLNYRQPKTKHQLSESHRNMKKFLMPYCSTCHIAFKSPMMYETHRCSLDHIKRKARNNESTNSDSGDEKEVNLNNFLTVDSVGEIDHDGTEDKIEGEEGKEKVNVGIEHVKKTEAFYCDLCGLFFAFKDDEEAALKKHCSTRSHLKSFLRYKENQTLRQEAERLQRRQKETKKDKKDESEKTDGKGKNEAEEAGDDKLWEDVDKDLGDLLRDVEPDDHDDDEEDGSVLNINIERFDRFKNTEKSDQKDAVNGIATSEETLEDQDSLVQPVESTTPPAKAKNQKDAIEVVKPVAAIKEEKVSAEGK